MPKTCSEPARRTLHGPTMGTRWSVTLDDPSGIDLAALADALAAAVQQVDEQMSPWKADSDLNRLNHAPVDTWVALPAQMLTVLARALEIARLSAGAFDPTVGALVDAWGFGAARDEPDAGAIQAARNASQRAGHDRLELDLPQGCARKHALLQIDLCGIAKGYAVDQMTAVLRLHGAGHALIALDGELRALGCQSDGSLWPIALESPQAGVRAVHGVIELSDMAVASSGDYRRFWQVGEARLAHTMDLRSAAPLRNAVASVTVLAADCIDADAWATALLVAGPDQGLLMAQRRGLEALFLLRRGESLVELGSGRFGQGVVDKG